MNFSRPKLFTPGFIGVILFIAFIHIVWWLLGSSPSVQGAFADGDSYLRLLRVERLFETGNWFDISIPEANAPYGTTVHWTRLFDVILLIIAVPLMPFLGSVTAIYSAGMIISPILHVLMAGSLMWALRPLMNERGTIFAGAVSVTQAGILVFAIAGRADHHMMFVLLASLAIGYFIRGYINHSNQRSGVYLGIVLACGIWVGPEFLVFTLMIMGVGGLSWIVEKGDVKSRLARFNLDAAAGLFAGLILALFIERGMWDFALVEYDRLSIVHMTFAGLATIFWWLAKNISTPSKQIIYTIISALVFSGFMFLLYPKILGNPVNDLDPAIQPIFAMVSEYQNIEGFPRSLIYFGSAVLCLPWMLWRLKQSWKNPTQWAWILLGLCFIVYVSFAVSWLRWALYAALFMSIILGDLISFLDDWITKNKTFPRRVFLKFLLIFGLSVGPLIMGASLLHVSKTDDELIADKTNTCPVEELTKFLNKSPHYQTPKIIVTSANFGPEIIYRTTHKVLATVHHRSVSGILDGYSILNGAEDQAIIAIIQERLVDLIILCPGTGNDRYFLRGDKPNSLYKRLQEGQYPVWVEPVVLPKNLNDQFLMFRVQRTNL